MTESWDTSLMKTFSQVKKRKISKFLSSFRMLT
jgi:hypothetical protein